MLTADVGHGWRVYVPPPFQKKKKWLSLNDRNHWSKSSPLTRYWRTASCDAVRGAAIPELSSAWVLAWLTFGDNRRRDVHNYMPTVKAAIDGCTDAGLWVDDRDEILTGPDLRRVEGGPVGLTLNIFEVVGNGPWGSEIFGGERCHDSVG